MSQFGLLLSDDLIFTSKVQATARAHGGTVRACRTVATLLDQAKSTSPTLILFDLNFPQLDLEVALADLRHQLAAWPRVIGYGSHVDVPSLKAARQAGLDRVMPRSQFVDVLEQELPNWLGVTSVPSPD